MRFGSLVGSVGIAACCSLPVVAGAGVDVVPTVPVERSFEFIGSPEGFRVPVGLETIDAVACGGQGGRLLGGDEFGVISTVGALGGEARSTIEVTTGERLVVRAGGTGDFEGGYNGGGAAPPVSVLLGTNGAGGGGASDVRQGGAGVEQRVLVGGGGGGGGAGILPDQVPLDELFGGAGGGGDAVAMEGGLGATATAGGTAGRSSSDLDLGSDGAFALGGAGAPGSGGGGGGLYGGGGGSVSLGFGGGGGGGSSLGDSTNPGVCEGDGSVTFSFEQAQSVRPFGAVVDEGDAGSTIVDVPVFLLFGVDDEVSVDWSTASGGSPGLAAAGADFIAASGTATFAPGQTETSVSVEVLADTDDEPDLLWGEWLVIEFSNPSANALLDTNPFFGSGLIIIVDDDTNPAG